MGSLFLLEETFLYVMLAVTHCVSVHTYILSVLFAPLVPQSSSVPSLQCCGQLSLL